MENYNNENYLKRQIMDQSRHLFIYGFNNQHRSDFLKRLEDEYPLMLDSDKPVALYFDSLGISKTNFDLKGKDSYITSSVAGEFVSFSIASKILSRAKDGMPENVLNERLAKLITFENRHRTQGHPEILTFDDYYNQINRAKDFYYRSYIDYVRGATSQIDINQLTIPFMNTEMFVQQFKSCIGLNSYFGVIYDKKAPIELPCTKAINNYLGSRINGDLSIKVAIEPNDWESYRDVNGQFVEAIHDYGNVELDDCYRKKSKSFDDDDFDL